jgi:hypothetical protein
MIYPGKLLTTIGNGTDEAVVIRGIEGSEARRGKRNGSVVRKRLVSILVRYQEVRRSYMRLILHKSRCSISRK